jgi:cytochrome c-type biogenesis protein CcmH
MREEIEAQLSRGVPKEAVVASFVERYGTKVLSAPPRRGFHWAAWLSPIVALLAGGLLAAKVLASWRRQTPLSRTEALARTPSSEQHRRIERELLEMET